MESNLHALVRASDYGLPHASAKQKLTPLDMNMPRLYGTRWILCFALDADVDKVKVYHDLRAGLAHTIAEVPWIAGKIGIEEGSDPDICKIQVVDGDLGVDLFLNDLTIGIKFQPYKQLEAVHFPLSELSTAVLSPLGVVPENATPSVMAAQVNFIEGGVLLVVGVHHSVCDAFGFMGVLDTWARMTSSVHKGSSFERINPVVNDRAALMTGLPGVDLKEHPEYMLAPTALTATTDLNTHQMAATPFKMPAMTARIFRLSQASLAALKTNAAAYSTNDALHALVWRHITLARMAASSQEPNTVNGDGSTALLYSANIRSRVDPPLPPNYAGNASVACITRHMSFVEMAAPSGLTATAAAIRGSVKTLAAPDRVALTIGLIASRQNPTDYKFAYNGFLGPDLSSTSWADLKVYEMKWGSLGQPQAFRVPGEGADGSMVVLPRLEDGALEVVVALECRAMEVLLGNVEFSKYAETWA